MPAQDYRNARFLVSAAAARQFPAECRQQVAFAGRSNAGKSSAINALCDNSKLAKTSKLPGRTRLINYFTLDEQRCLVDLPGYGYAKVPVAMQREWQQLIEQYLVQMDRLRGLVIISDIRRVLKDTDLQMLDWCSHYQLPVHVVLTKADKLKHGAQQKALLQTRKQLAGYRMETSAQVYSATKKQGIEELAAKLDAWLGLNVPAKD